MKNRTWLSARVLMSILLLAGIGIWVSSCSKKSSSNPVTPPGGGTSSGKATVAGVVRDAGSAGNAAVAGATVQIVGTDTSTTTDANGAFTLSVPAGVTKTINITKTGYSLYQLVVNVGADTTRNVSAAILQAGNTQSVSVTSGGSVTDTKSNAVLKLPADFVTTSGNVSVTVTGLDPTTDQIRALPGGLEAVDANGNTKYLQPVSFAEYTVKDANGNVLQYNSSASAGANIELPIPVSLRGKPGYQNGDPIECYVFDPTDGKWKTPVPGMVGPSSVDGTPAIKATIFHLSWYGGAPAINQRACIDGYVKNTNGTPAVGVDVEAFPGGTATTDANGFFMVQASPSSNVRVVATVVSGALVSTAEVVVYTGVPTDSCYVAPDITLGAPQLGTFEVEASLFKIGGQGGELSEAAVTINLKTAGGSSSGYDSADVELGYGGHFVRVPELGSGSYLLFTGIQGGANFTLASGQQYDIKIDFDKNGTTDATGSVRMVGVTTITNPPDSGTVGKTFTATWNDSGTTVPGYSANYWMAISGDSAFRYFQTTSTSKVVGDGSIDSSFYGSYLHNDPLPAGNYSMSLWSYNGPYNFGTYADPLPNISGQNVTGYFYSYYFGSGSYFTCTGTSPSGAPAYASKIRVHRVPLALRRFYNSIPKIVRKRAGLSLSRF